MNGGTGDRVAAQQPPEATPQAEGTPSMDGRDVTRLEAAVHTVEFVLNPMAKILSVAAENLQHMATILQQAAKQLPAEGDARGKMEAIATTIGKVGTEVTNASMMALEAVDLALEVAEQLAPPPPTSTEEP